MIIKNDISLEAYGGQRARFTNASAIYFLSRYPSSRFCFLRANGLVVNGPRRTCPRVATCEGGGGGRIECARDDPGSLKLELEPCMSFALIRDGRGNDGSGEAYVVGLPVTYDPDGDCEGVTGSVSGGGIVRLDGPG